MNDRSPSYDDELRRLQAEIRELRQRADQAAEREARVGQPRQPRLARTCREDHDVDDYPETGDTFWILFLDSIFEETEGDQTPEHTERQEDGAVVAHSLQGYIAEDTVVFVFRDNGRWWIWTGAAAGATLLWGRLREDMDYDGRPGNGPGVINRLVELKNCTWDGVMNGSQFTAKTPYLGVSVTGPGKDTALWKDYIVNYQIEPDGTPIIVSDIWDDAIKTIKAWNWLGGSAIRDGWRELDGSGGADDTRGRYLRGEDDENVAGRGTVGLGGTGGDLTHTHDCHTTNVNITEGAVTVLTGPPTHAEDDHIDPWFGTRFIERFE